jgi:hypothetical protein
MKALCLIVLALGASLLGTLARAAEPLQDMSGQALIEGFKQVEAASVADAMEQLYSQRNYVALHAPLGPHEVRRIRRHGAAEARGT